jgi:hypothetical protein
MEPWHWFLIDGWRRKSGLVNGESGPVGGDVESLRAQRVSW